MATHNRSRALISSILHTPTPLPHIASLHFTWSKRGPQQASLRHFLRVHLPIIQFHNPNIPVTFNQKTETGIKAAIDIRSVSGVEMTLFPAEIGYDSDIMKRIVEVGQGRQSGDGTSAQPIRTTTAG